MNRSLLKALPVAGALVMLLPVAAHAATQWDASTGLLYAHGGVVWYNRSVGIQGTASYFGNTAGGGGCGRLDFTTYLDEAETRSWDTTSRAVCNQRDFHFTMGGPQGGIRAVRICGTDEARPSEYHCDDNYRSQDSTAGPELPTLPDVDVGS